MSELILVGGKVFTARPGERAPLSGGVAFRDGRIVAVGRDAVVRAAAPSAATLDVGGRTILPGFVDAHNHLAFAGAELAQVDVRAPGVASIAELVARVAEAAERTPDGRWIRAVGMNHARFAEGRLPTRWDLDQATPVHPVIVQHISGHHALANSLALELRGLTDAATDPEGGRLVRDDRGRLTGYCFDAAQQLVVPPGVDIGHHGPGFHDDAPPDEVVADVERGSRAYLAVGITSIVDAQVTRRELAAYREAQRRGTLGVRVTAMPISSQLPEYEALGIAGPLGSERLAIGPMKFYADGALTGGTAAFSEPFGPNGEFTGSLYWSSEDDFRAAIGRAHRSGWQVGVHAQGDRAIDRVLDALEAALASDPGPDRRHRIEHCGGPRPDQLERMAHLGVHAIGQPRYFFDAGDDWLAAFDTARAGRLQPYREMTATGVQFAISTDAPVASYRPFDTISTALTRRTLSGAVIGAEHALSLEEALRAYTYDAASSYHAEERLGSLAPGLLADVVVVDGDLFATLPERIPDLRVALTFVGGEVAYDAGALGLPLRSATSDNIS